MTIFVLPILKPVSSVTTTVTQTTTVTTTTVSQATQTTPLFGPPPTRILGYFSGCPTPLIPQLRVPIPVLTRMIERCNIRPPWIRVIPRWSVLPARYVLFRPRAF